MAHEAVLACGPLKRSRRVYEKGANPAEPERARENRTSDLSVSDLEDFHCVSLCTALQAPASAAGGS